MQSAARCEREVTVTNKFGLHVRAVGRFVDTAQRFASHIRVRSGPKEADGKSIIEMLTLGATPGAALLLIAEGQDATQAIQSLEALVSARFHEE